jgi:choline transport protein
MSEEVRDAAQAVPKAMIAVYIINFCLIFPAVLTVAYHIPNTEDALADPTLYPTIYVLRQAMDPAWLTVMLTIVRRLHPASVTAHADIHRSFFCSSAVT